LGWVELSWAELTIHVRGGGAPVRFGKHSNGTLLHRYGFAEWDNDLVTVQIDAATVDIAFGGEAVVAAAAKALKQPWTDDDYTFELDPDGTVDAELLLVLRCVVHSGLLGSLLCYRPGLSASAGFGSAIKACI
jgi:hypothetical protein